MTASDGYRAVRPRSVHALKTVQPWFGLLWDDAKHFEARKFDRFYQEGDALRLREFTDAGTYTGREVRAVVDCLLTSDDHEGIREGYCIMSITITGRIESFDQEEANSKSVPSTSKGLEQASFDQEEQVGE
jgi:hypothetical protein